MKDEVLDTLNDLAECAEPKSYESGADKSLERQRKFLGDVAK